MISTGRVEPGAIAPEAPQVGLDFAAIDLDSALVGECHVLDAVIVGCAKDLTRIVGSFRHHRRRGYWEAGKAIVILRLHCGMAGREKDERQYRDV